MARHIPPPTPEALSPLPGIVWTWEGIRRYLGRGSRRTVLRWHAWRPMPVSRIGPHVCAPKAALDLWILDAPKSARGTRPKNSTSTAGREGEPR